MTDDLIARAKAALDDTNCTDAMQDFFRVGDVRELLAEVERLRAALEGLADDLAAHNQTTPDDDDHEIICDVESTIAWRIRAVLRGDQ
ncbi:hypothetical protein ABW16_21460 [Mycolicibacter heraklionensis]|uniref:Uncharacterized protein n=1 Tax=Mycolicibacter heraklionensis TaxID=512402 RepID=A0ABR5FA16_9MYCO|nr:hypothetical protein [Mycolicibacter heraklionensis]KLO25884.1 hypothetical protein ABW16_21460 [Mycolicibacter heraklionensis]